VGSRRHGNETSGFIYDADSVPHNMTYVGDAYMCGLPVPRATSRFVIAFSFGVIVTD
jgi:hypothetical protein